MSSIQNLFSSRLFPTRLTTAFPLSNLPPSPSKPSLRMDVSAGDAASANVSVTSSHATNTANAKSESDPLIQYVVLRRDLIDTWPLGSIVSQGCHASVAAISTFKDDPHTIHYCNPSNLEVMRKVNVGFFIPNLMKMRWLEEGMINFDTLCLRYGDPVCASQVFVEKFQRIVLFLSPFFVL